MADWLDDLSPYAAMHVAEACKDWRQSQTRRPTPAEILKLTKEAAENWQRKNAPKRTQIAHYREPWKPSPNVVRDNFRTIRVADRTEAELAIVAREIEAQAIAAGFPPGPEGRLAYAQFKLKARALVVAPALLSPEAPEIAPP